MNHFSLPDLMHLCLSIGCLLLLSKAVTSFSGKLNLPAVLGEILLGVLIGPTLLKSFFLGLSEWLYPTMGWAGHAMETLAGLAVLLLLFVAGMETDLKAMKEEKKRISLTAAGSALIPFVTGFFLVSCNPMLFQVEGDRQLVLSLFLGIALSISALPVVIRILMDLGIYRTKVGMITVAAGSIMDVFGWVAFTVLLSWLNPFSFQDVAHMLWSHATLLSFIAGIIVGNSAFVHKKTKKLAYGFIVPVLSPLFFLSIGVKVNFVANWDLALIVTLILVATFSKLIGSFIGARLSGLEDREALTVGFALNVRGAMEIILSRQALEAGLIETPMFVALVVMALFTSVLSVPAIKLLSRNQFGNKKEMAVIAPLIIPKEEVPAGRISS